MFNFFWRGLFGVQSFSKAEKNDQLNEKVEKLLTFELSEVCDRKLHLASAACSPHAASLRHAASHAASQTLQSSST